MAHILIVDDARNIRKMVDLALRQDGHQVEAAEDGARALEAFATGDGWDLVLVDQQMPNATGREVIIEARRRDPGARFIMMTAFATHELASQVLGAGALDFLRKPFTTEVLRGAVQAALAQPRQEAQDFARDEAASTYRPSGVARTSWRVNGWSFWPLDGAPRPASAPASLELGHTFRVRGPLGNASACFVGVTAHIREQAGRDASDDEFWEAMCAQSLLNFLWDKAAKPPAILPLFEMPHASHRSPHSLIRWGPFGG